MTGKGYLAIKNNADINAEQTEVSGPLSREQNTNLNKSLILWSKKGHKAQQEERNCTFEIRSLHIIPTTSFSSIECLSYKDSHTNQQPSSPHPQDATHLKAITALIPKNLQNH